MKVLKKCRICGSLNFAQIITYKRINLDGQYSNKKTNRKDFTKNDLTLLQCNNCGFIQLKQIIDDEIYNDYNFASFNTLEILDWIKTISEFLKKKYEIKNKKVLEVGSGDGSFSKLLNDENNVLAVEPSEKLVKHSNKSGVQTLHGYFDNKLVKKIDEKFDWIFVRHVLEHIDELESFCENLNLSLTQDGYIYLEQPYAKDILKTQNYFNVFYEHVNYFTLSDINNLFKKFGLKIIDYGFNKINNGSFWVVLSKIEKTKKFNDDKININEIEKFFKEFNRLSKTFEKLKNITKDKIVAGYGAANKTFSILNLGGFAQNDLVEIYDKNENLHGKYIPYFNYIIVDPKLALQTRPQFIIIFATAYQDEIIKYLKEIKYKGKVIKIFPKLSILDL